MKGKTWKHEFLDRTIVVRNRFTRETLEIDGEVVAENKGGLYRNQSVLRANVEFGDTVKLVEARIATRSRSLSIGCHILIDNNLVGGDTAVLLDPWDYQTASCTYQKGFGRFLLTWLTVAAPIAIVFSLLLQPVSISEFVIGSVTFDVVYGVAMARCSWPAIVSRAKQDASCQSP